MALCSVGKKPAAPLFARLRALLCYVMLCTLNRSYASREPSTSFRTGLVAGRMCRPPVWLLRRPSRLACWQRRTAVGQRPCGHQRNARRLDLVVCKYQLIRATNGPLAGMDASS